MTLYNTVARQPKCPFCGNPRSRLRRLWQKVFGGGPKPPRSETPKPSKSSKDKQLEISTNKGGAMSESSTVVDKMRLVFDLRKKQGWDGTYVEGELALMMSLVQAGESPEDIARATLHNDWPSLVAKFRRSPDYLKVMGFP
jgi:hypothetical protein